MKEEYDFSNARRNPYTKKLKKQITINIDSETIDYFKDQSASTGIPYQTLINLYLMDCAARHRRLNVSWEWNIWVNKKRIRRCVSPALPSAYSLFRLACSRQFRLSDQRDKPEFAEQTPQRYSGNGHCHPSINPNAITPIEIYVSMDARILPRLVLTRNSRNMTL